MRSFFNLLGFSLPLGTCLPGPHHDEVPQRGCLNTRHLLPQHLSGARSPSARCRQVGSSEAVREDLVSGGCWRLAGPRRSPWLVEASPLSASTCLQGLPLCMCLHSQLPFLYLSVWLPPWHVEIPGQGSDLSCSCGNTGSLTLCAGPGIEPVSWGSRDTADPRAPQWELPSLPFNEDMVVLG